MSAEIGWDEFRLVKAIADARSLSGAAQRLNLNHSTVFRRLAGIEKTVGARLFERSRAGYEPTLAGEEMVAIAGRIEDSVAEFQRRVAGRDIKPTGQLRVTVGEAIGHRFLPGIIAPFQAQYPGVVVDLILANHVLNLSRREADVAIRMTNDPPETLVGRRICAMRWAVYRRRDLVPHTHFESLPFVGFADNFGPPAARRWIETQAPPARISARANTLYTALALALHGFAALLPCFMGDPEPQLTRIGEPQTDLDVGLWILTHSDLRRSARVRAFMDFAGVEFARHRRSIEGAESDEGPSGTTAGTKS